ncbi:MAG: type II toxin-antitoxin system VapC family toxin [Moraxella sp.]|uniref:type II toxin-antitoxin system VapC family toxin n=1 Tax=Moraxella sp. TaxID=479 RepID=UPI0026DAFD80|nr:type II toxin-antitoxin system VapC family toxin [Moraxella sp.]MDO4449358.1 type II toxin-antitoxin system VapC family toxin [Moraxella sp.]
MGNANQISTWQIAINQKHCRIDYSNQKYHLYEILTINENHILNLQNLEYFHKDPFDRIIISQAMIENPTFLTIDEHITKYPIKFIN